MRPSATYKLAPMLLALIGLVVIFALAPAQEPDATAPDAAVNVEESDEPTDVSSAVVEKPEPKPTESINMPRAFTALGVGVAVVLGLIIVGKVNAFLALISAALAVSLIAPGDVADKIGRVAEAFGTSAGKIGIVIALAAVIGDCMLRSGAADRIVRAFLRLFGEKRSPIALMGSGFVLAVPVFFDTVFYLLVPLARSLHRKTGKQYLKYILAIGAGGAITHTLVPPTPGPLVMAEQLGFDIGLMIMIGLVVALPAAIGGLITGSVMDRLMPIPMRSIDGQADPEPLADSELPSLWLSVLPVVLPVLLISGNTVLTSLADAEQAAALRTSDIQDWAPIRAELRTASTDEASPPIERIWERLPEQSQSLLVADEPLTEAEQTQVVADLNEHVLGDQDFYDAEVFFGIRLNDVANAQVKKEGRLSRAPLQRKNRSLLESLFPEAIAPHTWNTQMRQAADYANLFGNANLALLLSTVIAMGMVVSKRSMSFKNLGKLAETSLLSGGLIILITAGGGAFGEMLKKAQVGNAIEALFKSEGATSSEAGLIMLFLGFGIAAVLKVAQGSSTVAMITGSGMLAGTAMSGELGFHPVYLATAIGAGSLIGSWMNDSGFWIFAKMGGLTEVEALKSWTVMLLVLGTVSFSMTLLLASVLPDPLTLFGSG